MDINEEQIKKIAKTARLELTESEVKTFVGDFQAILEYFEVLDEVDVSKEEIAIQPVVLKNALREDKVEPSLSNKDALKNSKSNKDGYFMGPSAV